MTATAANEWPTLLAHMQDLLATALTLTGQRERLFADGVAEPAPGLTWQHALERLGDQIAGWQGTFDQAGKLAAQAEAELAEVESHAQHWTSRLGQVQAALAAVPVASIS